VYVQSHKVLFEIITFYTTGIMTQIYYNLYI